MITGLFVGDANSVCFTHPSFSSLLRPRSYINCDNIDVNDIEGVVVLYVSSSKPKFTSMEYYYWS